MDDEGSLYVSDADGATVRRYGRRSGRKEVRVADVHGEGAALDKLTRLRQIFVDADHSVYVPDRDDHRVVKWKKGATEAEVLLGGTRGGSTNRQFNEPGSIS